MNKFHRLFTRASTLGRRVITPVAAALALAAGVSLLAPSVAQAADPAQLSIADGVIVKFGAGAGLYVRDRLTTGAGVTFTSQADDQIGGQVGATAGSPKRGDWLGVIVAPSVAPAGLTINGLSLRYGGGTVGLPGHLNGGAALSLPGGAYSFSKLQLLNNTLGVRVIGAGSPSFSQSRFAANATGLQAEQGATPSISESDISGNTDYGVRNLQPASVVNAQGNWWGHASGPRDTVGNPAGQGNPVSAGVNYGQYLQAEPVLTCTMAPTAGYVTRVRTIQLQLDCPQAAQYRIAEQSNFTAELWLGMEGTPTMANVTLSSAPGEKMIYVQFRTAQGSTNTFALSQPIAYAPSGPLVQFDQPAAGAVLTEDTSISVSAIDPEGVRDVEILVNGQRLALLNTAPYQTTWPLATVRNGSYTLTARATSTQGLVGTASRQVTVQKAGGGTGPAVALSFAGQPLAANATITQPGVLAIAAESPVGIARIQGSVNGVSIFNQAYGNTSPVTASQFLDFAQLPNGSHTLGVVVTDGDGGQTALNVPFTLNLSAPPAPTITSPANGAKISTPQLGVSGTATPGSRVQVYVDGQAAGSPVTASANGNFATSITLTEGSHQLTARASNSRGDSPMSQAVSVTYTASVPTVVFVSPAENATLSADTVVEVSAVDAGGIAKVDLYANDQLIGSRTSAPWSASWALANVADGAYTLRAVATNTAGKTAQATRAVTVQKVIPPPPPPPPPYVVRNVTITPAISFGTTPIQISGEVVTNPGGELVPTAALRMILRVQGFERRLNLVSDATGRFSYSFVPQSNDAGTYEVRLVHPEDVAYATRPANGSFTINRLSVNYAQYKLNAIRGFASSAVLNVSASAGTGATGVRWQAVPADQPSGSLPPGITLDAGTPIDIAAGTTAPTSIKLTGSASAGATGTIILKLFANESGATPRAELRLDYQLHEARPGLTPEPTALEIGVQQTKTASGKLTITNKGYSPAQNVRVQLLNRDGSAAPAWVSLASSPSIGALDIGQSTVIQVDARPGTDVNDGYYQLQLKISADNDPGGTVPVTIAVARDGQGGVRFKLVDIYTNTLDAQGKPIEGLANARITLQNEALTADIRTATTNTAGIAEFTGIPPGNYRWRASAANHSDASGRITVSAGLTANERVFLDYQVVSIEFSVTETTIRDVYNITLEATYQTQVPAPVVLLEPMSINLPALQLGEEFTGELTLSNYGLVRADEVKFALPTSDENFKYEFFGQLPTQLAAKSRVSIPFRITSLKELKSGLVVNTQPATLLEKLGAGYQPSAQMQNAIRQFLRTGDGSAMARDTNLATIKEAAKAASCSSYQTQACASYQYDCAAGDVRSGSACSSISRVTGNACGGPGGPGPVGTPICTPENNWCGGGGGGWGGGWGGGSPIPLSPTCVTPCKGPNCRCPQQP